MLHWQRGRIHEAPQHCQFGSGKCLFLARQYLLLFAVFLIWPLVYGLRLSFYEI